MCGFIHIHADTHSLDTCTKTTVIFHSISVCHVLFHKEEEFWSFKVYPKFHNFEKQVTKYKYIKKPAFHRGGGGEHNCSHTFSLLKVSEYSLLIFLKSSYCRLSGYQLMVGMMWTCTLYGDQLKGEIILFIKCADKIQRFCTFLDYTAFLTLKNI